MVIAFVSWEGIEVKPVGVWPSIKTLFSSALMHSANQEGITTLSSSASCLGDTSYLNRCSLSTNA
jgi:hypothetical protein